MDCANPIDASFINYPYEIKHFPNGFMCNRTECLNKNPNITQYYKKLP